MTTATEQLRAVFEQVSQLPEDLQNRYAELFRDAMLAELRREVQIGLDELDEGAGVEFDAEDIIRRGHERLAARRKSA